MRVSSKVIAAELLEMTFRKDNDLNEYQLPLNLQEKLDFKDYTHGLLAFSEKL